VSSYGHSNQSASNEEPILDLQRLHLGCTHLYRHNK
jgi:hypothetical protein